MKPMRMLMLTLMAAALVTTAALAQPRMGRDNSRSRPARQWDGRGNRPSGDRRGSRDRGRWDRRPGRDGAPRKAPPLWTNPESLIVRAMALGGDRIAVAGPVDLGKKAEGKALAFTNEPEARAAFEGKKGVFLRIVNAADGKTVSQSSLPAMPAFDGMSTADGKLYISLKDGTVRCFGT